MMRLAAYLRGLVGAALAGALGGALVGTGEAVLVSWTGGTADEYWLFLFAVITYGLLGAGLGIGGAVLWQLVRRGRALESELVQLAIGVAVVFPGFAVTRYHVAQRIFGEKLAFASFAGILTHLLVLIGAVVGALIAAVALRLGYRKIGMMASVTGLVILGAGAFLIGALAGKPASTKIARRAPPPGAAGKPNIILVIADTLRADAVDWTNEHPGSSGGFSQLAADGVLFERAYAQASWTRPSIASILTSQYPSVHGAVQKMDFLPDYALTVAEALRGQGYWTAAFTTNINVAPIFNLHQGFDEFTYLEPSFYFWASDSATKLAIYKGLRLARERFLSGRMYFEHYYQDAAVVDRHVEGWLEERPPEPFFLFIHYMDPHDPYFEIPYDGRGVARVMTPSPPVDQADELHDLYMQGVRYLDGYVKAFIDRLRATGTYDRSVVAFTADHGEEFQEHGGWWHGTTLYEEQLHVPLVVKRATEPKAGQRRSDMARTIDIAPTLMAAAGLSLPQTFFGMDVFAKEVKEPLLAEEDLEGNRLTSIRAGAWKLITANAGNPRGLATTELYNLERDPEEKHNLAAAETERVAQMLAQLEQLRARIAERNDPAFGTASNDVADPRT